MSTTRYFLEQVMRKRPYVMVELCRQVLAAPLASMVQDDGRIRYWGCVTFARRSRGAHLKGWNEAALLSRNRQPLHRAAQRCGYGNREVAEGLNADFGSDGAVVGFDIDGASKKLDLGTLEAIALPIASLKAA